MADFKTTTLALVKAGTIYTLRECALLLHLHEVPNSTVRGAAAMLGVSKPVITRGMDRLVMEGMAGRKEDKADRRSVFLKLTAKGEKLVARWV